MNLHAGLLVQCESIPHLFARAHRMTGFEAQVQGPDEIGIFPLHCVALAKALGNGARALMKSPLSDNFEFPVQASVIPGCAPAPAATASRSSRWDNRR